ncbi:MAG: hypothetical protein JOY58_11850 [Solirubrobacterales bacterium]|nr:hypothetical protein [Solirubrobacterales bacterium]
MSLQPANGRGDAQSAKAAVQQLTGVEETGVDKQADPHAEAVIEARLGRPAHDVLEATVVLEAWIGTPARNALSAARDLLDLNSPPLHARSSFDPDDREQRSVLAEGITLVLLILSVAAWAAPINRRLGPSLLPHAIRAALPIAVALQWGLRSRYLSRRDGLASLARDGVAFSILAILLVELPLVLVPKWGPVAAMLVPVWVGGTVLTRRGWGLIYAAVLVLGTVAFNQHESPYAVLGALTAITLLMCVAAVLTRRRVTDERAGSMRRAMLAAILGGCIGVLLVADPSLGWGVHGIHPAIALLPSVIGSFWGGYYLWNFYVAIPQKLRGVPLTSASRAALSDPAMSIFVGAVLRLVGATVVLSAIVVAIGNWTRGTDATSVFVAFGCVGLVTLLLGLLESFALQRAALIAACAGLAAELGWRYLVHPQLAGEALAVGAAVGVLLSLPPLVGRLARSGRVLATMLWIQ